MPPNLASLPIPYPLPVPVFSPLPFSVLLPTQPKFLYDKQKSKVKPPGQKIPSRPMPEAGKHPDHQEVP